MYQAQRALSKGNHIVSWKASSASSARSIVRPTIGVSRFGDIHGYPGGGGRGVWI